MRLSCALCICFRFASSGSIDLGKVAPLFPDRTQTLKRDRLTLIEDATHLMSPFAGVGVNVGMHDALKLARSIIARKSEWDARANVADEKAAVAAVVKEYELTMWARSSKDATKTAKYTSVFFNPIGAEYMVEYFGNIKAKEKAAAAAAATHPPVNTPAVKPEKEAFAIVAAVPALDPATQAAAKMQV